MSFSGVEILEQFSDRSATPPLLDDAQQSEARNYFRSAGLEQAIGAIGIFANHERIGILLEMDQYSSETLKVEGSMIGPCFIGEDYYPNAVGVWVPERPREGIIKI